MPSHEEETWRLAEIARNLDFRHEFRQFTNEVVRKDVYSAHMVSVQLQIDTLKGELKSMLEEKASDRREVRKAFITAALSVAVATIMLIMQVVIK